MQAIFVGPHVGAAVIAMMTLVWVQDADRAIERAAAAGWTAARELAPKGGALDLLGPVNARLKELDALDGHAARYAEVAIRAAVSAAQDEHAELDVFLQHARDLSDIMALTGETAKWPVPIDEMEGELLLEVDQYARARDAFQRATKNRPSPNAWVGLARASHRLGDTVAACAAYTQVASTAGLPSTVEIEISLYLLKCKF